jgi:HlyD family secretion protein
MSVTTTPPPPSGPGQRKDTSGPASEGTPGGGLRGLFVRKSRDIDTMPSEVMEYFSPSQAIIARGPLPLANNVVAIVATMVLCIIFCFFVLSLDRLATGMGKVVSMVPETVVQPLNPGIVKTIAVSTGDIVHKGQLLAQIDPTFAAADNTAAREQVDRYQTEVDRLMAEYHQQPYRPHQLTAGAIVQEGIFAQRAAARQAELRYYQGQVDAQKALLAQADSQIRQYAKEAGVNLNIEQIYTKLEHDAVGSRLNTLNSVNVRLESERNVLFNISQAENARQNVAALQGQLENYNQQWFADVSQTITDDNVQLASYRDQLEHAALNYKLVDLRAQEDSIVLAVAPISPGAVIQAGQTFFTLVPVNAPMEIDAQITADQTGFVAPGQMAIIKFQTFSFTKFGMASGAVRLVSPDSFITGQAATSTTGTPSGATGNSIFTGVNPTSAYFFDVRVSLDRLNLKNVPRDFRVTPGMPVEVDIKVGDRTVIDYLVERMLPVLYEGMREPD